MKRIHSFLLGIFLFAFCLNLTASNEPFLDKKKSENKDAKYYVSVAVVYFKMHENELAETYLDSALQIDQSYAYAHVMLSKLSERLHGNHPETIRILTYAVKETSSNLEKIQLYCKIANIQVEDKNYTDCMKTVQEIFTINKKEPTGHFESALLHYKLEKYNDVLKIAEKGIKGTTDKRRLAEFNFLAGLTYKRLKNPRKAEKHFIESQKSSMKNASLIELKRLKK